MVSIHQCSHRVQRSYGRSYGEIAELGDGNTLAAVDLDHSSCAQSGVVRFRFLKFSHAEQ